MSVYFFLNCVLLYTLVFTGHDLELQKNVRCLVKKYSNTKRGVYNRLPYSLYHQFIVSNQLVEHNKICYLVLQSSSEMFATVLLLFICNHLPINVYLLRRIVLIGIEDKIDNAIIWFLIAFQTCAAFIIFAPLAWSSWVHHRPKGFMSKLGFLLSKDNRWFVLQMKFDDLFGRLVSGPKVAVSIGNLKPVTTKTALDVSVTPQYFNCF